MKSNGNLIGIIAIAGAWYAISSMHSGSQATSMERTVNDQVSTVSDTIKTKLAGANNPFASAPVKAQEDKAVLTNTVGEILIDLKCAGKDWTCTYSDLKVAIPVVKAKSVLASN